MSANKSVWVIFASIQSSPSPFGASCHCAPGTGTAPALHPAFPYLPAIPHLSFQVPKFCWFLQPEQFNTSGNLMSHTISRELYFGCISVAFGLQFSSRYELTFKKKKQAIIEMLLISWDWRVGGVWHFALSMGEEGIGLFFSHKKHICFWMQSTFFAMGPKTVFIHWLMASEDFFPELRKQML